ncbi:antichymotrypsin-1-like isoform X2 [Pectinophora gossypiella]|uniref:antichymotrypsin-1-like isoform X2 n=1 Tax=Pectinophora gossypiella TaxID=13191 RepID=UPI00214E2022|nr:antichymotrypsin-1-like isoform X2 [Pectinophora gossypiella]
MLKISLFLFAAASYCLAEGEVEPSTEKWHYPGHEFDRTRLGDAVDLASMKLLKEAYTTKDDKNIVASPIGVLLLLSLYAAGAEGGIRDEIIKAVGSSNYDEMFESYTRLSSKFSFMDSSYLTLANKVYVADNMELANDFSTRAVQSYNSEVEKVDFTKPADAVAIINKWADEKTKGHIKDAVTEDVIDDTVVSVLCNVIFFQGHWNVPFNASETVEKDFHVDKSKTVKKQMMHLEQPLFYQESPELGAKMIELPYKENGFRMVVVLPDEIDGLSSVMEKVAQKGLLADVFALSPAGREIHLDLPKFEIKSGLDLNGLLPKIGVSKIFSDPAQGIVKDVPVKVSKAFQKAFVKVDEEGATAGAFTGFTTVTYSSFSQPLATQFIVDHPFLFAILHEDKILFAGTYSH